MTKIIEVYRKYMNSYRINLTNSVSVWCFRVWLRLHSNSFSTKRWSEARFSKTS